MRTEQINYLAQIAESGSLHKAAENLHISVQALAMSLSSLEHELGLNLTVRQKNGTTMTKDGEKVLQAGKHFLQSLPKSSVKVSLFHIFRLTNILTSL